MKKLTKFEVKQVEAAAQKIVKGTEKYTCLAIGPALRGRYKKFYSPLICSTAHDWWQGLPYGVDIEIYDVRCEAQLQRSLMLLLFAELEGVL